MKCLINLEGSKQQGKFTIYIAPDKRSNQISIFLICPQKQILLVLTRSTLPRLFYEMSTSVGNQSEIVDHWFC